MGMWKDIVLNNCEEGQPSCAILPYMYNYKNMHYSLSVFQQYNTFGKSYSCMKWIVWEDVCYIVRQIVLSFCNCVTMQVSNSVSNLILGARIKKGGSSMGTLQICFCNTKMLADKSDDPNRRKKISTYDVNGNMIWKKKYTYISSSISERYLNKLFWMKNRLLWIV